MTPSLRDAQVAKLIAENERLRTVLQRFANAMEQKSYPELQGIACEAFAALAEEQGE